MDVIIAKDYDEMSKVAAGITAELVRDKQNAVLGFATGGTPIGTYRELVRMHKEEGLDFSKVLTFNLDEYLGISMDMTKTPDKDQSYARFMYEQLFKDVNISPANIHVPNGLATDPDAHCRWYEEEIKKAGGVDIQVLGIGGDGHWAFNEPGASLASRTRVEPLTKETLDDNYKAFYKKAGVKKDEMPHFALTMGIGTILESRHALMLINGEKKADVAQKAIEGPVTNQITASAIQLHPGKVTVVLDKPAASKLKNKKHYLHVQELKKQYGIK